MLNDQRASTSYESQDDHAGEEDEEEVRDIHALTPPHVNRPGRTETWETSSHRSTSTSMSGMISSENFTTMSREFSALVLAGSAIGHSSNNGNENYELGGNGLGSHSLERIGEEDTVVETNPLAIVPDNNPLLDSVGSPRPRGVAIGSSSSSITTTGGGEVSLQRVKKEEVESKITAWQNAKIAKINNRFKREEAIIHGREGERVQKAQSWMKKIERKLEEKRAKALEKMQNKVAKARRKAEERRASAEAKRGTKIARVIEVANLMRAVGRTPTKRSFF